MKCNSVSYGYYFFLRQILLIQRVKKENELKLISLRNDKQETIARIEQKKQDLRMVNETKTKYEEQFEGLKTKRAGILNKIGKI